MKFGIFTVSMPDYDPERALEVASGLGYDGLEWRVCADGGDKSNPSFWGGNRTSMTPEDIMVNAEKLKETASKLEMEMPSLAPYIDCYDLDAVEKTFQAATAIGAKTIRISAGIYALDIPFAQQIDKARKVYSDVAKLAARYNVKSVIETHHGQLCSLVSNAVKVLDGLDPAHVGIMYDPANQIYEGRETHRMALDIAGDYLAEVHVKNAKPELVRVENGAAVWQITWAPLRVGMVNWKEVFAELKKIKYDGWVMFEDFSLDKPLIERLEDNLKYIKSLI